MSVEISDYVQLWLEKANNDLKNSAIILAAKTDSPPLDTVCFHCQQAVEKLLKGFLTHHQKRFPYSHNLADLVAICMEVDKAFSLIQRQAETLTPFAVEIRYPDDFYMPTLAEAQEAYKIAVQIRDFIFIRLEDFYPNLRHNSST
jgi:HEPN domain-containing protein